jgi:esterase/lipase superfamily enzyme
MFLAGRAGAQAAPGALAAAEPSALILQGTVVGPDGAPVADARVDVRLQGANDDVTFGDTTTDVDGKFALLGLGLAPEHYAVHASAPNLDPAEQPFAIDKAGHASATTFTLKLGTAKKARGGPTEGYTVVKVYYATDRKPEPGSASQSGGALLDYAGERAANGAVSYGAVDVSIPPNHRFAERELPSVWRLEFHADPEKHMTLRSVSAEPKDHFFQDVAGSVRDSPGKEAFVFVHGYNVSFQGAAIRTAQLAYDFGFKGAPIFYSWPSRARLIGYEDDEKTVTQSTEDLRQFLQDVANRSGATVIHLIAHSMGNRAFLPAVAELAGDRTFKNFGKFQNIVLAAPDVDADVFTKWVTQIKKANTPVTLYVSDRDQALLISHTFFNSQVRAGQGGANALVIPGVDTIDVSKVSMDALGHTYYGDNPDVVNDLLAFLKGKAAPRTGLTKVPEGALAYWLMNPPPG